MTNIIKSLQNRISARLTETKNPCKTYATSEAADRVGSNMAPRLGNYFSATPDAEPCRYVTVYIEEMDRWTVAFDFSELLSRPGSTGGYLGVARSFYTY